MRPDRPSGGCPNDFRYRGPIAEWARVGRADDQAGVFAQAARVRGWMGVPPALRGRAKRRPPGEGAESGCCSALLGCTHLPCANLGSWC